MAVSADEISQVNALLSPKEEAAPVEDVVEAVEDEGVEDEIADETITDETDEAIEEEAEAAPVEEEAETYTLKEFGEAIEWTPEQLYTDILIPLDGDNKPMSVGDLKNGYQNLVRDKASLETQLQNQQGQTQGINQMSAEMMEAQSYLQSLNRMEANKDWSELEELDPSQAVLERDKIRRARDEVMGSIQQLQAKEGQMQQQMLQQAQTKMLELIPTWSDQAARETDQGVIRGIMNTVGFNDAEINGIVDPRTMLLLKELADLRTKNTQAGDALKKVRGAPKVIKKGRSAPPTTNADKTQALVNKAKKTGNKHDQLAAVNGLLKGRKL